MIEKTLLLLKPDALKRSARTIRAKNDLYNQLKINELSIIAEVRFTLTQDVLIDYQPVLDTSLQSDMTLEWKDITLDYQLGKDRKGKEHLLILLQGYNAIPKGLGIKKYIRNTYCSPWDKYAPGNLIHAPDTVEEYELSLNSFYPVVKGLKSIPNIEFLTNLRREK